MSSSPTIGLCIPTFNAADYLKTTLPIYLSSTIKPRILVIDSSSTDDTQKIVKEHQIELKVIPKKEFNHGLTREMGRKLLNTDIIIMVTQDAIPKSEMTLEHLITPLIQKKASISYARQLPVQGATFLESFHRYFNYPDKSHIRSLDQIEDHGVYTFFCSNSCAAYLNSSLNEIGGFPTTHFGEDTLATALLLKKNHKIAYVAEAEVYHSHDFTLMEELKRYFAIGKMRTLHSNILQTAGKDSSRGADYAKSLIQETIKKAPALFPYALLNILAKSIGYYSGKIYQKAHSIINRSS